MYPCKIGLWAVTLLCVKLHSWNLTNMCIYTQECAVPQNEGGILPGIYDSALIYFPEGKISRLNTNREFCEFYFPDFMLAFIWHPIWYKIFASLIFPNRVCLGKFRNNYPSRKFMIIQYIVKSSVSVVSFKRVCISRR